MVDNAFIHYFLTRTDLLPLPKHIAFTGSNNQHTVHTHLEALPVDNGWARLVIFLFGDPHLLEC